MRAQGACLRFDCSQGGQFEKIGCFWDVMRNLHPSEELLGVGFGWNEGYLEYLIGQIDREFFCEPLSQWLPEVRMQTLVLPDDGWEKHECTMKQLAQTYEKIWKKGKLDFEIERFEGDNCFLMIHYAKKEGEDQI